MALTKGVQKTVSTQSVEFQLYLSPPPWYIYPPLYPLYSITPPIWDKQYGINNKKNTYLSYDLLVKISHDALIGGNTILEFSHDALIGGNGVN